jgi:hypothetical protein
LKTPAANSSFSDMKTLIVDDDQRVRLPHARPRSKFAYEESSDGKITLTELREHEPRPATVRLEKRGGYTVAFTDQPITEAMIKAALTEFP